MKIKKILSILLMTASLLLTGCGHKQRTLYKSDSIEVVRENDKTAVIDLITQTEYKFISERVKLSEAILEPYTAIDTETVKIDILPYAGIKVYDKTAKKIFTYERKYLHNRG